MQQSLLNRMKTGKSRSGFGIKNKSTSIQNSAQKIKENESEPMVEHDSDEEKTEPKLVKLFEKKEEKLEVKKTEADVSKPEVTKKSSPNEPKAKKARVMTKEMELQILKCL